MSQIGQVASGVCDFVKCTLPNIIQQTPLANNGLEEAAEHWTRKSSGYVGEDMFAIKLLGLFHWTEDEVHEELQNMVQDRFSMFEEKQV